MLNGGELNGVRIISRKSVELMSHNHVVGKADGGNYGLGFGAIGEPSQLTELGSVGSFDWGGFYYTSFVIDPKEDMIAIFMGQINPAGGFESRLQGHNAGLPGNQGLTTRRVTMFNYGFVLPFGRRAMAKSALLGGASFLLGAPGAARAEGPAAGQQ